MGTPVRDATLSILSEGRDTVYFEKGNQTRTQLNEVNWESHAIGIGLIFNF
jgi:hypothetical protein